MLLMNHIERLSMNQKSTFIALSGSEDTEFISSGELLSLCLYDHKYQGNPKCFFVLKVQEIPIYCMEIPPIEAILGTFQSVCLLVSVQMVQGCEFQPPLILCSIPGDRWAPDLDTTFILGAKSLQCVQGLIVSSFSTQICDFFSQKFFVLINIPQVLCWFYLFGFVLFSVS